jgi:Helix-turn-helix domain
MYYNQPTVGFKPEISKSSDPGDINPLPFSALPHALRRSLRGNQTAIVLAATLLEYARNAASCYPTNATLASDMGCSVSTVRNALVALQKAGWIRLELGSRQPNGRTIHLIWRESPVVRLSDTHQPVVPAPQPVEPTHQRTEPPPQPAATPTQRTEPRTQPVEPKFSSSKNSASIGYIASSYSTSLSV